ncbi:hypothetical protein F5884DRAFT_888954 [Xylogone sp. PMI_703]|nr:hypothetical protein F5884DRAFT_888954 [Xylogone sp. PMI_703]
MFLVFLNQRRTTNIVPIVLLLCSGILTLVHGAAIHARDPIKVMIVGDSISHGRQGDYTWRYRIWQWFTGNGITVDLVGPYTGTVPPSPPAPPSPPVLYGETAPASPIITVGSGYAAGVDSAFIANDAHFAYWGRQVAQDALVIADMVREYVLDYLLVELGFNDLGWFVSDAFGTLDSMLSLVTNARSANSNIKFAIANVSMRTFIGGRDDLVINTDLYNTLLANNIPHWSTSQSPVYLVDFRDNYSCEPTGGCPSGTDGLHPDALGEYQIAKAFADTLHYAYGLGAGSISVPSDIPDRPCNTPTNIQAAPSYAGVTVTWDPVFGAYGYSVQNNIVGNPPSTWNTTTPRYDTTWTVGAYCANSVSGWTDTVFATANPTVAPGPSNIVVTPAADGLHLTWDAVEGYDVYQYGVLYWDSIPGSFVNDYGFTGTSASITGLPAGDHFFLGVEAWELVDGVPYAGIPSGASEAIVGGQPSVPTNVKVVTINEGATVQVTWDASANAAAYRVYARNINDPNSVLTLQEPNPSGPCDEVTFLFPGAWNFEFCVSAVNGNYESNLSSCVVAPEGITAVSDCPPVSTSAPPPIATPTVSWAPPTATYTPTPYSGIPTPPDGADSFCTAGTGSGDYADLCSFTCRYGFCPGETCTCTAVGVTTAALPTWVNVIACAAKGLDSSYGPLCSFACNYGYCPSNLCIGDSTQCLANVDPGDPVPNEEDDLRLARLNTMYPGIYWDLAMPDGGGGCSRAQLNILEEATRVAVQMTTFSVEDTEDTAFQRYFVTDSRVVGRWTNGPNRDHYLNLLNNLRQVSGFAVTGRLKNGRPSILPRDRITYRCNRPSDVPFKCGIPGVSSFCIDQLTRYNRAASTANPPLSPPPFGAMTMFCNFFWEQRFMASVTSGPRKTPADLGDPRLMSFEQALAHEWMHADVVGYKKHISDIKDVIPGNGFRPQPVYGSSRCHDYAWAYVHSQSEPNKGVVYNADNYAWTWVNRWFSNAWHWGSSDDGTQITAPFEYTNYWTMSELIDASAIPADNSAPISCSGSGTDITCVYYGEFYDDYLLDAGAL